MEFHLYNSTNKLKKYMVKFVNDATGKINTIHFGQKGFTDYTINNDPHLKALYKQRHSKDKVNDPMYAGFWSMQMLWNAKTIKTSIADIEKRFWIKIYNNL